MLAKLICFGLLSFLFGWPLAPEATRADDSVNSLDARFVLIAEGSLTMDYVPYQSGDSGEKPSRQVTISSSFYTREPEATRRTRESPMGDNPRSFKGDFRPMESLSIFKIQALIDKPRQSDGANPYRLTTEGEWEWDAQAITDFGYFRGYARNKLGDSAWFNDNSGVETHLTSGAEPNPWEPRDTLGNAHELSAEWRAYDYRPYAPAATPQGPATGETRSGRGGSWRGVANSRVFAYGNWSGVGADNADWDGDERVGFRALLADTTVNHEAYAARPERNFAFGEGEIEISPPFLALVARISREKPFRVETLKFFSATRASIIDLAISRICLISRDC